MELADVLGAKLRRSSVTALSLGTLDCYVFSVEITRQT